MLQIRPSGQAFLFLLFTGLLISETSAMAQVSTAKLDSVSKQMYSDGESEFIIVEAMKDGFIREGQSFYFVNTDQGVIKINDQVVPHPYQRRYGQLIADFNAANPDRRCFGSLRSTGPSSDELLNPQSKFRKPPYVANDATTRVVTSLSMDGLADTTQNVRVEYNLTGIYVNGTRLDPTVEAKYKKLILKLHSYEPLQPNDELIMSVTP